MTTEKNYKENTLSSESDVSHFYDLMGKRNDYDDYWQYDKHLYFQLHRILVKTIKELNISRKSNFLDVGCGTGSQAILLAKKGFSVVGIDISEKLLKICKDKIKRLNIKDRLTVFCASADDLLFDNSSFDNIVCFYNVLNHIQNYNTALKEISRVLKKGGIFFLEFEKVSIFEIIYGFLDIFLKGKLGYEITFEEWLQQLKSFISKRNITVNWTYSDCKIKYQQYNPGLIKQCILNSGFKIIDKYGLSVFSSIIPWGLQKSESKFIKIICDKLRKFDIKLSGYYLFKNFGLNTIYILRKN